MSLILGFGSTEEKYKEDTKKKIKEIVRECIAKFKEPKDIWFDEKLRKEIEQKVKRYAKETYDNQEEIRKKPIKERPERFSYIFVRFAGTGSDLFFGIDFYHINSQHPFSPDGMAMMKERDCLWIDVCDLRYRNNI